MSSRVKAFFDENSNYISKVLLFLEQKYFFFLFRRNSLYYLFNKRVTKSEKLFAHIKYSRVGVSLSL